MHNASHDLESLIRVRIQGRGGSTGSYSIEGIGRDGGGGGSDVNGGGGGEGRVERVDSEAEHGVAGRSPVGGRRNGDGVSPLLCLLIFDDLLLWAWMGLFYLPTG